VTNSTYPNRPVAYVVICLAITVLQLHLRNWFMNLSFENKVAVVTGAGSGMGLATARAFAEAGAAVALADVHENARSFCSRRTGLRRA
jgi:hypothetical protein